MSIGLVWLGPVRTIRALVELSFSPKSARKGWPCPSKVRMKTEVLAGAVYQSRTLPSRRSVRWTLYGPPSACPASQAAPPLSLVSDEKDSRRAGLPGLGPSRWAAD